MTAWPAAILYAASLAGDAGVRDAMVGAPVAFLGRVTATAEVADPGDDTMAEAEVTLLACYRGIDCDSHRHIRLRYVAQTRGESTRPIELTVAEEVLFVLHAPLQDAGTFTFDSDPQGGLDLAYRSEKLARDGQRDDILLRDVYDGASERVRHADLALWGQAPQPELAADKGQASLDLALLLADPLAATLPDEATLVAALGPGCVRKDASPPGMRQRIHHGYYDRSSGLWLEALVEDSGGNLGLVAGFVVASESLCDKRCVLPTQLAARALFGVALGDAQEDVIAILGQPLGRAKVKLGGSRLDAMSFAPGGADSDLVAVYFLKKGKVAGWSFERSP